VRRGIGAGSLRIGLRRARIFRFIASAQILGAAKCFGRERRTTFPIAQESAENTLKAKSKTKPNELR